MSLTVADDLGEEADANSYVTTDEAETILLDYGYSTFPSETDLILATEYLDTHLDPISYIVNKEQPLLWPREEFKDSQGREITGVPEEIKKATAMVAAEFIDEDLFEPEPKITSESYGDSSVTYAGAVSQSAPKLNKILLRLQKLGYASHSANSVKLVRA